MNMEIPKVEELFVLSEFTEEEKSLLKRGYDFALKAHEGQKRASGDPYFTHVFATAKNLVELGMDVTTITAGLLHDTVEDTPVTGEDVKEKFGEEIAYLVHGITKLSDIKYRGHERHVESLRKFFMAMANDLRVVTIKLADRLHNMETLQYHKKPEKQKRIALETIEIHARLADRLGMGKLKGKLEDLAFPYVYPKEYAQIETLIKSKQDIYEKSLTEVRKELITELEKNNIKFDELSHRMKHKYSLWRKLIRYNMDIDKIYDIAALRVVVDSVEDCYRVLGIIHSLWRPIPGRIKDYIALPKPNGYRSIHTTVFTGLSGIAEIQIRTKKMHAEAAYGIAAHFAYKENGSQKAKKDKSKFKWMEELKELNYSPKKPGKFFESLKMDFFNDRIFAITPRGDVVDLPEGSSAIDFAYAIHSDIGSHISGVKINGKMSPIFIKLENRNVVEVITNKNSAPSIKWLKHVKTSAAKKHIRSYTEKNSLLSRLSNFGI